ncbi:hypothetical protein QBC35DRAFT_446723 [Podospora australis]|uniref:Uncharacterized protein n=1 Tax=Podospora australis TaxID=1536484 RepID=A0AAN6X3D5_9PEZI|nr:hypothetical protein QBC35DRAFT_446723 [Podospora australis]
MCRYYAHNFICKHTTHSFAAFCEPAALIQTRCGNHTIWQTIYIEEYCDDCKMFITQPHTFAHQGRRSA